MYTSYVRLTLIYALKADSRERCRGLFAANISLFQTRGLGRCESQELAYIVTEGGKGTLKIATGEAEVSKCPISTGRVRLCFTTYNREVFRGKGVDISCSSKR